MLNHTGAAIVIPKPTTSETISNPHPIFSAMLIGRTPWDVY
jgi:hypothetical protein